jgi:hypothetical protein
MKQSQFNRHIQWPMLISSLQKVTEEWCSALFTKKQLHCNRGMAFSVLSMPKCYEQGKYRVRLRQKSRRLVWDDHQQLWARIWRPFHIECKKFKKLISTWLASAFRYHYFLLFNVIQTWYVQFLTALKDLVQHLLRRKKSAIFFRVKRSVMMNRLTYINVSDVSFS